jgi:hypothetical protein
MTTNQANWLQRVLEGRYEVTGQLGQGGMGVVYRARDLKLGCEVVIKVPRLEMLQDAEFAGRFHRENRSLVQLAHPHIVKILDVGTHDALSYAVLQYLCGGSLRTDSNLRSAHDANASYDGCCSDDPRSVVLFRRKRCAADSVYRPEFFRWVCSPSWFGRRRPRKNNRSRTVRTRCPVRRCHPPRPSRR